MCKEFDQDLLLYAHGELGFARSVRIRRHLATCEACRERYEHFRAVSHLIASTAPTPRDFSPRLARTSMSPSGMALLLTLAAVLVIGVITVQVGPWRPTVPSAIPATKADRDSCRDDILRMREEMLKAHASSK